MPMGEKAEEKRLAILRVLHEEDRPLSSARIAEHLGAMGHEVSERTVRFHLKALDQDRLTENLGKKGRRITERGHREVSSSRIFEKVGYLAAKIDLMTYRMDFNLETQTGSVVMNVTLLERDQLERAYPLISRVFSANLAMGKLLTILTPGERIGEVTIPAGKVGIGTICSITLNGILLEHGIPAISRFGGLMELKSGKPARFVELIHYEGTTLDPLEIFIRSGMTDYWGATETGNGLVGASFREVPGDSRDRVLAVARKMDEVGLGGVCLVGWPGRPLLDIPVSEGRLGVIVMGGLNPVAILEELGIRVRHTGALAGLIEYRKLFPFEKLKERVMELSGTA
jgi:repressor of nif and glnA expression